MWGHNNEAKQSNKLFQHSKTLVSAAWVRYCPHFPDFGNNCVNTQIWKFSFRSSFTFQIECISSLVWGYESNSCYNTRAVSIKLITSNKASFVQFMKWHIYKWWRPHNKSRFMGEMCSRSIEREAFCSWNGSAILTFSASDWGGMNDEWSAEKRGTRVTEKENNQKTLVSRCK